MANCSWCIVLLVTLLANKVEQGLCFTHNIGVMAVKSQQFPSSQLQHKMRASEKPISEELGAGLSSAAVVEGKDELARALKVAEEAAKRAGEIILEFSGAEVQQEKSNFRDLVTEYDKKCEEVIVDMIQEAFPHHVILGEESVASGAAAAKTALSEKLAELARPTSPSAERGSGRQEEEEPMLWIIDPIDGTTNFAMGLPLAVVSIAAYYKGEIALGCIYHPHMQECFTAIKGRGAALNGRAIAPRGDTQLKEAVLNIGFPPDPQALEVVTRGMDALRSQVRGMRMLVSAALVLAWTACGRLSGFPGYNLNAWDIAAGALILKEAGGEITDTDGSPYTVETRNVLISNGPLHPLLLAELEKAGAAKVDF